MGAEKKARLSIVRKRPKLAALVLGVPAALIFGFTVGDGGGEAAPSAPAIAPAPAAPGKAPAGVVPAIPGEGAPAFDAAAGKYNKEVIDGRVRCDVRVIRSAGSVTIAGAVNQELRGVWYSFTLSSQVGSVEGWGAGAAIAIADPNDVASGRVNSLNVNVHYPYGNDTNMTKCDLSGAGNLA